MCRSCRIPRCRRLRMASSARYPLRKMPSWAPRPEATIIAVGVARPSAHGHAITSTANAAENAFSAPPPASSQPGGGQRSDHEHRRNEDARDRGRPVAGRRPSATAPPRPGAPCRRSGCRHLTAAASTIEAPVQHDGPADHADAGRDPDRLGLTRHRTHIDSGAALDHQTVGGDRLRRAGPRNAAAP